MPNVSIAPREDIAPELVRDTVTDPAIRGKLVEGDLSTIMRWHHRGDTDALQLTELQMEPNAELCPHAHESDEILYVIEGELHFGQRVLRAGTSVYIAALTLYRIKAGPEGVRFLTFFGRQDYSVVFQDELKAQREAH